ncbi:MAG: FAD-binding oxidoreductase [Granulosicoccus sp.]|nr:FAD-binding oxidoreductase [Granulosicoccus sp.]
MKTLPSTTWPNSLWHASATPFEDVPPLRGNMSTDIAIIGAGYTGLSTALHLAESEIDSIVIDRHQPGWGCSGRNGGQVNPCWKVLPDTFGSGFSDSEKRAMIRTASSACDLLFDLVDFYGIDCQAIRPGYILGVIGKSGKDFVESWCQQWQVPETATKILNREQMASTLGSNHYDIGMLDRRGGSVQPLSYARGLARVCQSKGVSLFGNTPALGFERTGDRWRINTPNASITCNKLVMACNGYTDEAWPDLKKSIVPVASLISATQPLPTHLADKILPGRHAVSDIAGLPLYYRVDENNRLVFGGRGSWTGQEGRLDTRSIRSAAVRLFPELSQIGWEYDWGGYVAMTTHHRPMLMQIANNAWAGMGYNGRGVAMATMMGKQLSLVLQDRTPGLPVEELNSIPLHQFNKIGIACRMVSGYLSDRLVRRLKP